MLVRREALCLKQTMNGIKRMSTQDLLQAINEALVAGETEYYIEASYASMIANLYGIQKVRR